MRLFVSICLLAAIPVAPAVAQNSLPGLENFTLERPRQPAPTPTATPSLAPSATRATPAPIPTPSASVGPTPGTSPATAPAVPPSQRASATETQPGPVAPTIDLPLPAETVAPLPTPRPTPPAAIVPESAASGIAWPLWLGLAALVAAAVASGLWWRRRQAERVAVERQIPVSVVPPAPIPPPVPTAPAPVLAPPPAASAPVPASPLVSATVAKPLGGLVTTALRPALAFDIRPLSAGVDTLRATLDFELYVRNTGRAPAHDVAIEAWLFGAGTNPGAELAEFLARPPATPLLPPFVLPPSASADLAGQTAAPREALATISAGERKLFVPMLLVRAQYRDSRGAHASASAAFFVGVERPGQERLAPLALDRGARGYEGLAARRFDG